MQYSNENCKAMAIDYDVPIPSVIDLDRFTIPVSSFSITMIQSYDQPHKWAKNPLALKNWKNKFFQN